MKLTLYLKSLIAVLALSQCEKAKEPTEQANAPTQERAPQPPQTPAEQKPNENPTPPVPLIAPSVELQKEFLAIVNSWNELPSRARGKELVAKQRALAYEAVVKLAGGAELTQFLKFLKSKGGADLHNELIERGMMDAFRVKGEAMREWALSVEDYTMKEALMIQAGMAYDGNDIAAYFERVGQYPNGHNCQCRLMTGYCSTMAKTDPLGAIKVYGQLCHPKRINNSGLAKVMEHVQPDADFLEVATIIEPCARGLSKNTRRSLLANWSQHRPAEAAQYVMTNTTEVDADQMAVVMSTWAQNSPEEAAKWLAEWDASTHKDQGSLALTQYWLKQNNPGKAFAVASSIGDFALRVKSATEAFNQWSVLDRKAAEEAWVKAFPQK